MSEKKDMHVHFMLTHTMAKQIKDYAVAHGCTKQSVLEKALRRFFGDTNDESTLRVLARMNRRIKACMDNVTVSNELVFMLMRMFFMTFPPAPEEDRERNEEEAIRRLDGVLYDIAKNILTNERVTGYVMEKMASLANTHIPYKNLIEEEGENENSDD